MKMKNLVIAGVIGGLVFSGGIAQGLTHAEERTTTTTVNQYMQMGKQGGKFAGYVGSFHEEVAKVLQITIDELYAARANGESVAQIAASKGITEETLVSELNTLKKARLDQAVTDGVITQEQADLMYTNMEQQTLTMINSTEMGPLQKGQTQATKGQGNVNKGQGNRGQGQRLYQNAQINN